MNNNTITKKIDSEVFASSFAEALQEAQKAYKNSLKMITRQKYIERYKEVNKGL
jgi:hypothetical protein